MSDAYFSVSAELLVTHADLPYSVYINSSGLEGRERFVCVARQAQVLSRDDVQRFVEKYRRLYLRESERSVFMRSVTALKGASDQAKSQVLKDTALQHMKALFELSYEAPALTATVRECREVVDGMTEVVGKYADIDSLRDLISALSIHDFYTYDHSINVGMYSILIYRLLHPEASHAEIVEAGMGGILHDLGKVRISNEIINKTSPLTPEEFAEIQRHPDYGYELLRAGRGGMDPGFDAELLSRVVHEHHENFDGTGYPRKLVGPQIHELSRIVAIADFFDAVTTKRSYHEPLCTRDALALMDRSKGKKIDPMLFELFCKHIKGYRPREELWKELPSDFDPCQPCRALPLMPIVDGEDGDWEEDEEEEEESVNPYGAIKMVVRQSEGLRGLPPSKGVKVIIQPKLSRHPGKKRA